MIKRSYKASVYNVEIVDFNKTIKVVELIVPGTRAFRSRKSFIDYFNRHYKKEQFFAVVDFEKVGETKETYGLTDTEFLKHAKKLN